ncbi:helix-turn-helix domain-containing protein [Brevibacillus sp. SYSU BS000544]|uniref:helix-turn-helix domain-containing protein n=1 Tax=Brevibacillus sp. SYSU BS000544 TaxID=3416443 RepID=UPI003CE54ECD
MDRISTFNPNRLRAARVYEGMSIAELSGLIGVSKQVISQYENGKAKPSLETLLKIMNVLNFPREYFYLPDRNNSRVGGAFFRSALTATKITKDSQIEKLESLTEAFTILDEYIDFPKLNIPVFEIEKLDLSEIELIAEQTRQYWGLGLEPINNIINLLERNGVIFSSFETTSHKIDAFSQTQLVHDEERFFIILGSDKQSAVRRHFDAAHEIGHKILHSHIESIDDLTKEEYRDMERQADYFAASFLLPRSKFLSDLVSPVNLNQFVELKKKWKVSIGAMVIRAYLLGAINYNQYQYMMRQMSKNGWRTKEPLDDVLVVPDPTVLRKAVDLLLMNNVIKAKDILQRLGLPQNKAESILNLKKGSLVDKSANEDKIIKLAVRQSIKSS